MARNVYFTQGTKSEQYLLEDIIIESLKIYGQDVYYIPRTLVNKDIVLGEDVLSTFDSAYDIEMYFEDVDDFQGQGTFLQKFGIEIEKSATLVVARRRWEQMIGRFGIGRIPTRPAEGDLIYFPLTKKLFEIRFVEHEDPFYQIGKLYTYKLRIETFQYASERLNTGIGEIDAIETNYTYDQLGYELLMEDPQGVNIRIGDEERDEDYYSLELATDDTPEDYSDGKTYDDISRSSGLIDFDERNPFGEVNA
jgi:hypothetical protein